MSEQPMELAQVARDDELVEALVRGEAPPADDQLAGLLAAWRTDLDDDRPQPVAPRTAAPATAGRTTGRTARRADRRAGKGRAFAVAAAAVLVGLAGGTTAAAANAGPDSPLWPITRVVFADRADSRLTEQAEEAIAQAKEAIAQNRLDDAARLLDQASADAGQVKDAGTVRRLLDEISSLRGVVSGVLGGLGGGGAGGSTGGPGGGAPSGGPAGGGTAPGPTPTSGGGLPSLPPLPLPTISVCLPILCP